MPVLLSRVKSFIGILGIYEQFCHQSSNISFHFIFSIKKLSINYIKCFGVIYEEDLFILNIKRVVRPLSPKRRSQKGL